MNRITQPLTNVQLEILKAFSFNLNHKDLQEFKELLANYFAQRAIEAADKSWEDQGWTDQDIDKLLQSKLRKSK